MLCFKFRSIVVTNLRRLMPLLAAAALVLSTATAQADHGDQLAKLLPDDGATDDRFGYSVAISGTTAIVGAPGDDDDGLQSGSAYLFDITMGRQIAKLLADDGAAHDHFGISVGISGATVIVGADRVEDGFPASSSAYLFDATTGRQIAELLPEDDAEGDRFGWSVGISGATAIVGANRDDDNGTMSGSAYLFDTTTGKQIAKLLAIDGSGLDHFGISVAISGTAVIVGAPFHYNNGDRSGSAYLFDATTGRQVAKLLPNDGAAFDQFGNSVAISGATAIVGAYLDDDNGSDSGSAYLFDVTTGRQVAKLVPNDGATFDQFGISVALSGTIAIVGARFDDDNGVNSGSAYLFDISTGQQTAKLLPDDGSTGDDFGRSVAIGGATAIVGAHLDDDNGDRSGSAYLFDAVGTTACPWDFDADSVVGAFDLAVLLGAWGPNAGHPADLDGDGDVDAADLAALLGHWGPCPAIVCLDPYTDPTYLNCPSSAECEIDGEVLVFDLFECHCLEGVAEEQCCEAILERLEAECESSGGTLLSFSCNCFP